MAAKALVLEEHQVQLQPESASAALQLGDEGSEARREWCIALQTGPCVALLVGMQPQQEEAPLQEESEDAEPPAESAVETLYVTLGPTEPGDTSGQRYVIQWDM